MEDKIPENLLIRELASRHRVILVGGMAVIGHGHARRTKDYDIWLEPMETAGVWAEALVSACARHPEARFDPDHRWRSAPVSHGLRRRGRS